MVGLDFLRELHLRYLLTCVLLVHLDRILTLCTFDDPTNSDVVDLTQQRTFSLDLALREVELGNGTSQAVRAVGYTEGFFCRPWMLEALVDRYPLLHIDCKHAVDQVKRRIADRVPVW